MATILKKKKKSYTQKNVVAPSSYVASLHPAPPLYLCYMDAHALEIQYPLSLRNASMLLRRAWLGTTILLLRWALDIGLVS